MDRRFMFMEKMSPGGCLSLPWGFIHVYDHNIKTSTSLNPLGQLKPNFMWKGTSRQRSGKGAIRKRFPLQKPRREKTKSTIRYLYHETHRKPNEQLFSQ